MGRKQKIAELELLFEAILQLRAQRGSLDRFEYYERMLNLLNVFKYEAKDFLIALRELGN